MNAADDIKNLAKNCLEGDDKFIVDVLVSSKRGSGKVLVIVDGDNGVSIDDCADLSRKLSKALDDSSIFQGHYLLEVSSPGLDHPLTLKRQFIKNIGRKLKIVKADTVIEGSLEGVSEVEITVKRALNGEQVSEAIPFSEIRKAFVLISFK
jgi:ribosome maturation factor RimP